MTLASLRAAFDADRKTRQASAKRRPEPRICRYCGLDWWYLDSSLDGHAMCAVSEDFRSLVAKVKGQGKSYAAIAETLGVGVAIIRAWVATVRATRKAS
jgi:hypothetical protein